MSARRSGGKPNARCWLTNASLAGRLRRQNAWSWQPPLIVPAGLPSRERSAVSLGENGSLLPQSIRTGIRRSAASRPAAATSLAAKSAALSNDPELAPIAAA